jgi:sterol desaturase/sphingolipid hydroxylase (fatty acid hydroxylase superfamily)
MTFNEWALAHEPSVRLGAFFGVFTLMAVWEAVAPRRKRLLPRRVRWVHNLALVVLNSLILRLLFPVAAVGFALLAAERGWGLLNAFGVPFWWAFALSVITLDFLIYLQHVMFHAVPLLWRLHRMHHADLDFDVTTGARFHPIEILLSMLIKFAVIAVIGAPAVAVVIFEVVLNATAMFNHGNLRLPAVLDRVLRLLIVTPDMHRVHHSIEDHETNSNFGFNLSLWDRMFGTYKAQPDAGHEAMTIGIRDFREPRLASDLPGMLILPFLGRITGYAINRRSWGRNA